MEPFDLLGPLPTGTTVLEASAGTGKTYALAGLVTRYVAEGAARLDEMLLITFGRAASQELRERVRSQLLEAERALADPDRWHDDPGLLGHLVNGSAADVAVRHGRLRDALANFDAATIATTHQFCQLVLRSLGVAGDTDAGVTLVDDLGRACRRGRRRPLPQSLRRFRGATAHHPLHRAGDRAQGRRQPAHPAGARAVRRSSRRRAPASSSRRPCSPRWSAASAASAFSGTTTC